MLRKERNQRFFDVFRRGFREAKRENILKIVLQNAQNPFFLKFEGPRGLNKGLVNFPRLEAPLRCVGSGQRPFSGHWVKTTDVNNFVIFIQLFNSNFDLIFELY